MSVHDQRTEQTCGPAVLQLRKCVSAVRTQHAPIVQEATQAGCVNRLKAQPVLASELSNGHATWAKASGTGTEALRLQKDGQAADVVHRA